MRHSRRLVFLGVIAALAAMTILSVAMGQVASLLPKRIIYFAEVALFIGFGLKLLYDASQMSAKSLCDQEVAGAAATIDQSNLQLTTSGTRRSVVLQAFALTFLAEWGDRTQIATISLAAFHNPIGVTIGAILGHTICAIIAVIGGRLIAGRISERTVTAIGGCLFLLFGILAAVEAG
jgi:putative Ca2+/H+ antiporter (TMEM165/GDT1 family)